LGIFPQHIPLINRLIPGVLRLKLPKEEEQLVFAISGGFLEVQGNKATILADIVERSDDLDEAKLIEQKRLAEERLKNSAAALGKDDAKAYAALELIVAQLKALEYSHKHARRS